MINVVIQKEGLNMPVDKLIFKDAENARDAITKAQKKNIAGYYKEWAKEVGDRAEYYKNKTTSSSVVSEQQMKELQKFLKNTGNQVSKEVRDEVTASIYTVSDAVVKSNAQWLADLGFTNYNKINAAFNSVSDNTVRNLITGNIYESGWSLSKRIWSDSEDTMKVAYKIVAGGMAQNKSVYDIAKDLQKLVQPGAKMAWNLRDKDGRLIYPKQVDYNAQRLARTLVQHGYQQSFLAVTKNNPFIEAYKWNANGSRVCPICRDRESTDAYGLGPGVFPKNELLMDHPNGMCIMEPIVVDNLIDRLADWFNADDGTYPEIDEFAKNFGYASENAANTIKTNNNIQVLKTLSKPQNIIKKTTNEMSTQDIVNKSANKAKEIEKQYAIKTLSKTERMLKELEESKLKTQKARDELERMKKQRDDTEKYLKKLKRNLK